MHSHVICICTRLAAAAEEVVYEVVAEPPEPLEQAQQEERRENQGQGPVDPSTDPQTQGKPRYTSYYLKLLFEITTPIYVFITCALYFRS